MAFAYPKNIEKLSMQSQRILLLQGPNGAFFTHFSAWLTKQKKCVFKINLNAGDEYFYPTHIPHTFSYTGQYKHFHAFLSQFITDHQIDSIVCFGDNRPYHLIAKEICKAQNLAFWVFEEGYFRPHYVTLGENGVNAFSYFPNDAQFFLDQLPHLPTPLPPSILTGTFKKMAWVSAKYYIYAYYKNQRYPHYIHHRKLSVPYYIGIWMRSAWIRTYRYLPEKKFAQLVSDGSFGRFFLLPLQVFNDSQVKVYSDFSSVASFLLHVLTSFANHAPKDTQLIVKHHPMDRGVVSYQRIFKRFFSRHPELANRIHYVFDVSLPVLLRQATGIVTLNSTVGLSALIHNLPVKVLGRANYNIPDITDQQPLATFWHHPTPPNQQAFHAFRTFHLNVTQLHGNFYSKVSLPENK